MKLSTQVDPMTVGMAARILGWPRMRVYRYIKQGKIGAVKYGGILFVPASEVQRIKDTMTQKK